MDENLELQLFESSKNLFDSEEQLKESFGTGYKEYDFEPDGSTQQLQETENKVQDLWRVIEKSGIVPCGPKSKSTKVKKPSETPKKPRNWMEALKELSDKGMDKEAYCVKQRTCKICEHADLGQFFADEVYQDRYVKIYKASSCD